MVAALPHPPLILEFLSAREISPAALVRLAARHEVPLVSICLLPFKALAGEGVPFADLIDWDLVGDTPNRRALKRLCEAEGVGIASADPFILRDESAVEAARPALESAAWLGARAVTVIVVEADPTRHAAILAGFCAAAADHGLGVLHEHSPRMAVKTFREALAMQRTLAQPNLRLVVDALHFFRGDNRLGDLAALQPHEIGRVQLCDAPREVLPQGGGYEAFYERMVPGEGGLPLADLLRALPGNVPLGMEVPLWAMQEAGVQAAERVARIVAATRRLIALAGAAP